MECMTLLGLGACTPDPDFRASLAFPCRDIDRSAVPAPLRRRTSQATQMAFCAAIHACAEAGRSPAELPAVFASVGGEIQVTDQLCIELAKPDGVISPTAFHNSVHNTAAGYWSIVHHCTQPLSALAAGHETFAMALLESWCHLACHGGELLLVCYDERWAEYLAPPIGAPPFACALVVGAGSVAGGIVEIGRPHWRGSEKLPDKLAELVARMPVAAAIPLLTMATAVRDRHGTVRSLPAGIGYGERPLAGVSRRVARFDGNRTRTMNRGGSPDGASGVIREDEAANPGFRFAASGLLKLLEPGSWKGEREISVSGGSGGWRVMVKPVGTV